MTWDAERAADIAALPLRTRWRYRLRPAWLRYAINRACPGRWTQLEVDQIRRRARQHRLDLGFDNDGAPDLRRRTT